MNGLIVLLCRNTLSLSLRCLYTLLRQSAPVDILIVDNASTDSTPAYMASQQARHANIYRFTYPEPVGVARAWNEALRWGWGRGYNEALVVNADTELLPETYERLAAYLWANKAGVVTGVEELESASYPGDEITPRPHPAYSCYMIARWAHRQVPFDELYDGAYFEDEDHHVRLFRAGIWAGSINLGFLHRRSSTLKHADEREQARISRHYQLNKQRFVAQYGCAPGTKAYERLFLPAHGKADVAGDAEQLQQPDNQQQNDHNRDDRLDRSGHGDVGLNQPQAHADNH